ncbi:MAG: tyrosine-protein phosphatase [Deltaproteobacteria bacterium]|nr:tyrosine-protein phosphatase [Deltaproteobacteria bacterium]
MSRPAQRASGATLAALAALAALSFRAALVVVAASCGGGSSASSAAFSSASVERESGGALSISWSARPDVGRITVYAGMDPQAIDRSNALASGAAADTVRIEGLDPLRRHYFALVGDDGEIVVAERRVPLEGAVNFRDIGGHATREGRRVRWGRVFRSDELNRLTADDLTAFSNLGLKVLCDFRSPSEYGRNPDLLPSTGAPEVLHFPIFDPDNDIEAMITTAITTGDHEAQDRLLGDGRNEQLLVDGGRTLVTDATEQVAGCIRRLADPASLPTLTHCTAGKDRTGFTTAVVLLALGVPEETVMEDYLLSNVYRAERNDQTIASLRPLMRDSELLRPVLEVRPEYLQASFDTIAERYGSIDAYLRDGLGLDRTTVHSLRENLLD